MAPFTSTVLTNGRSDWSVAPLPQTPGEVTIQVTRQGSTVRTQYLQPAGMVGQWQLLRLGHLPLKDTCQIGIMTCSPKRGGLRTHFRGLSIITSRAIDLHPHE
ncbi:regulation of enolase protein 1 (concanavalin A-like superfamily) [Arthrobacter sp. CG_A4]|nr:regulation of enolase protein 1 (concanavalin A-like superfamily) [Arthrobacter sp. CG_A4]